MVVLDKNVDIGGAIVHVQKRILFNKEVLANFRKENKVSQKELADMMGTLPNVVSYWETGRRTPLPSSVDIMVEVTKIPHRLFYAVNYETLGTRLTTLRLRKNASQQALAQQIFTTPEVLNRWEADRHIPSAYYSYLLAEVYNLTIEELFDNEDLSKDIHELETVRKISRRELNAISAPSLGEKIIALRGLGNMTQRYLSDIIDTRPENVNRWEANRHVPNVHYIYKIAKVFGLTMEDLITNNHGEILIEDPHVTEILEESIISNEIERI